MSYLSRITFGRYVPTGSVIHGLDARTKLLSTVLLLGVGMSAQSFPVLACHLVLVFATGAAARLRPGLLTANLRPLVWLLVLMVLLNGFLTPGSAWFRIPGPGWALTREGIRQGLFLGLRLATLVLMASLLTLTTSPLDLSDGLERLLRPARRLRVPVHELAMTLTIALRFVPVLAEETERLRMAQLSRGADFEGSPIRRVRGLTSLLVPLFLSAFRRADRLATAMEARGYRGEEGRTHYARMRFGRGDAVAAALVLAAVSGLWCWK